MRIAAADWVGRTDGERENKVSKDEVDRMLVRVGLPLVLIELIAREEEVNAIAPVMSCLSFAWSER